MDLLTVDRLALVVEHAVAPAFLLGAVAGFLAILLGRTENLLARMRLLVALSPDERAQACPEQDVARLGRRVGLLHRAVFLTICSGIAGTLMVAVAFLFGFLNLAHIYGLALFFLLTLGLLGSALVLFAREVWLALREDSERAG